VIQLWFRKFQFESQNELDDRQVEGYHGIGTSPLSGNCGVVTNNFFIKGGCPPYVLSFDESSKILTLTQLYRQQDFYNTQVIYINIHVTSMKCLYVFIEPSFNKRQMRWIHVFSPFFKKQDVADELLASL
jgi:hypothetical protein